MNRRIRLRPAGGREERRSGAGKVMFRSNPYGMFAMPTLETPRLILRRIAMRDAQDIFAYSRDPEVARHVLWSAQKDISEDNGSAAVAYTLAKWLWDGGYITEALRRVIAYTFEAMDINRIEAQHELDNASSGRVMEKCGMVKEGVLRQRLYNKGKYVDVALYAILRDDYETLKKQGKYGD